LKPAQANNLQDPISKILNTKQGWWGGSSGRGPEFKLQNCKKKKMKTDMFVCLVHISS
jgi:hypothetical protein